MVERRGKISSQILHWREKEPDQCELNLATISMSLFKCVFVIYIFSHSQVPECYTFIQVVDLFFKSQEVFNLNFHKNVCLLFNVIGSFVYGMNIGAITPKNVESAKTMFASLDWLIDLPYIWRVMHSALCSFFYSIISGCAYMWLISDK